MQITQSRILYQDDHLLAVNKRSMELVVRGKGEVGKLPLFDVLKQDFPGLRSLHRLDFETSGVVIFAKSKQAYDAIMKGKFEDWKKIYRTLVMGKIRRREGVIDVPLPARSKGGTIKAITKYKVLRTFVNSSDIEAEIETGRQHQIRKHFSMIHHPLILDHVYGHQKFNKVFREEFGYRNFFLHASSVSFVHPITGKTLIIEAPLPKPFEEVVHKLQSL